MNVQATQLPSSLSTAAYPPWVMLEPHTDVDTTGSYATADPKTLVVARTFAGDPIGVSLRLASPPAESRVCFHFPHDAEAREHINKVIAAHRDSLLNIVVQEEDCGYFVYSSGTTTGAGAPKPPSLSLLPPIDVFLDKGSTGLLRRGKDDLVVAHLKMVRLKDDTLTKHVAEVHLFRSGMWYMGRPGVKCLGNDIEEEKFLSRFRSRRVIPVGDDMLCWIDMTHGLIFSNVYDKNPGLRYVPLPADPRCSEHFSSSRNVCVTAGYLVKFVNIFARCCCGGEGGGNCKRSDHAYIIKTWTLRVDTMTWVADGIMDATELWALDAYKSLPRVQVGYPVVSMDEPHVICFRVFHKKAWLIMVDMRSKMLRSVYSLPKREEGYYGKLLLPSKVSYYLNSCPGSGRQTHVEPQTIAIPDKQLTYNASNSELLSSGCNTSAEPWAHASEILVALEEISSYGLDGDDMRKAISILSRGKGRYPIWGSQRY
ncbi:hypothetical protein EJB05_52203, partial [Eragrostis curvula]